MKTLGVKTWIAVGIASIASILILVAYIVTPSFFIEAGRHYIVGLDLFSMKVHTCAPEDPAEDCDRQGLLVAVAGDPNPINWLPVKGEFIQN